jgi:hypothetical protein
MLSTLAFAATAFAFEDLANLAEVLTKLEAAPEDELAVTLGKYQTCPGARYAVANIHAMSQMSVTFENSCADVAAEIQARGNQENGWIDPHNNGKYTVLAANSNLITTKRVTGNRVFTDKQTFAMSASASGGCEVQMCSESQGTSANDGGTNLCDMFDLFCNSSEKNPQTGVACKPIKTDLKYTINQEQCGRYTFGNNYAGHQCQNAQATCLKVANAEHAAILDVLEDPPKNELAVTLGKYNTCPGARYAAANIHTMAQMKVNFQNSCADVAAEVSARGNQANGWTDPHNNGHYAVLESNANMIKTKRRTGNNRYTDVQTFSLTSNGSGCTAQICSESQGTSANDGGTNLCDMYNLFCNSSERNAQTGVSCKPIKTDLKYQIESEECGRFVYQNYYQGHQCQQRNPTCLKTATSTELSAPVKELRTLA